MRKQQYQCSPDTLLKERIDLAMTSRHLGGPSAWSAIARSPISPEKRDDPDEIGDPNELEDPDASDRWWY